MGKKSGKGKRNLGRPRERAAMGDPAADPEEAAAPWERSRTPSVSQAAEMMEKRTCALCPPGLDSSVLYFARSENIAAHEKCLLYSSALVECEGHDSNNDNKNFDVASVKKEIRRGRRLKCSFCGVKGAAVGCDVKACFKKYHFPCARSDCAVLLTDATRGIYKVLCQDHAASRGPQNDLPLAGKFHPDYNQWTQPRPAQFSGPKRRGRKRRLLAGIHTPSLAASAAKLPKQTQRKEEADRHTDTTVKGAFLKKCKEAGLLDDLFEEMLDKLHLTQERLMDETASESEYEEIGTSLFDCRLFTDTFENFQAAIENRLCRYKEKQQQLREETELLQDLKQTLCSAQENGNVGPSSALASSASA